VPVPTFSIHSAFSTEKVLQLLDRIESGGIIRATDRTTADFTNIQQINPVSRQPMPFNLGNFLSNAGDILGIVSGTTQPRPSPAVPGPAIVPTPGGLPVYTQIGNASNFPGIATGFSARPALASSGTLERDIFDFGDTGLSTGGTPTVAQQRSFLLKAASSNRGHRVTSKEVKRLVDLVGIPQAGQFLGLEPEAVTFLVLHQPKRRRRGLSAADVSRTRSFLRRLNSVNCAVKAACGPVNRARPTRKATCR